VRTLFGESVPSGRLVVSWPRSVGQIPLYYDALSTGRPAGNVELTHPAREGTPQFVAEKYVSRYIDETNAPEFPFGFGLSYTEFRYARPEVSTTKLSAKGLSEDLRARNSDAKEVLTVSANVTNSGSVAAEEVVQLYVRLTGTSVAEPVRALKGFQRVRLGPGETKKVTFGVTAEAFALWDIQNVRKVEPCKVTVWVSPDSARGESTELEIGE
jgi:beta-glucosidase